MERRSVMKLPAAELLCEVLKVEPLKKLDVDLVAVDEL